MREAMQELQEARLAYSARRYSEAVEHYRKSLAALPAGQEADKQRKFIKDSLSDALIAKAIDYRSVGRTDEAVEFLKEAASLAPDNQRAELELVYTQDPTRTNPALSPQHVGDVAEVSRLLTLAQGYYDLGQYDKALETYNAVRSIDATNTAAIRGMEQVNKRRSTYFRTAHASYRGKALADAASLWAESPTDVGLPPELVSAGTDAVPEPYDAETANKFADALSQMVMPQIIFEEATISEVIEALQNQILRFENSGVSTPRHINLTANFGAQNSPGYMELMKKRFNLNLSEVSVRNVLDILTHELGITYYYTPVGIELSYSGADFGPLMERSFTVPPHFFDKSREAVEEEDEEEDSFSTSSAVTVRRLSPVDALKEMGISFPEGATARYAPSTRTLHVRNTAHNLAEVEELLNMPVAEERQVVLNVVVMQVEEKDLEELGFDWLVKVDFSGETYLGGGVEQTAAGSVGLPTISSINPTEADYVTSGLRSGTEVINQSGMDRLIEVGSADQFNRNNAKKAPGIFSLRGVWSVADVAFIMRGLNQKKGVDVLQNPQIVFSPGADEQVTFANVREMYYPESYGEPEVRVSREYDEETDDEGRVLSRGEYKYNVIAKGAHPTDFVRFGMTDEEAGGIGTILQIHNAEIMEDGRFLNLAMTTTVSDFEGFVNWGSPINIMMGRTKVIESGEKRDDGQWYSTDRVVFVDGSLVKMELSKNPILKPIFKRQLVNNAVTVVPGSVLVFAGMKDMRKIRYEDKVPLLGDLPLVGRFFRSEGTENSRKVLIYFAKVDVVDPAGRDIITGKRPGRLSESL